MTFLENKKVQSTLILTYSCGLRVSEVAMMQIKDIDSERMVVIVHQGKGRKDKITLLSEKMLDQLRIIIRFTGLKFGYLRIL